MPLSARAPALALLFLADKLLLNSYVDFARAQAADGLGAWVREAQHWGFRFAVALFAALVLFAVARAPAALRTVDAMFRQVPVRLSWLLAHFCCVACLVPLSAWLYPQGTAPMAFSAALSLWLLVAVLAMASALRAMAPWRLWRTADRKSVV